MTRVGVILSGCGHLDGSEIHEAVLSLFFLDRAGAQVVCFAPDVAQRDVIDHSTGKATGETRNVLREAARIARGKIQPLSKAHAHDLDALFLPGGFGAAKNLSDFALQGADATVTPELVRLVREVHAAHKPIGAVCIAPAVLAACLRGTGAHPLLTVGAKGSASDALGAMESRPQACTVEHCVVDEVNRIVTAPAYMYDARISQVALGIEQAVAALMRLAVRPTSVVRS
jgi:enhancing lycopene biosynthesis protein 2